MYLVTKINYDWRFRKKANKTKKMIGLEFFFSFKLIKKEHYAVNRIRTDMNFFVTFWKLCVYTFTITAFFYDKKIYWLKKLCLQYQSVCKQSFSIK